MLTYLYHLISEMRRMNHHHCQHIRMWRKEVRSRQIWVLEIGVVWPLKKPKYIPSTWQKYLWLHLHPWSCCCGTQSRTTWCPSNILGKVEVYYIIFFLHSKLQLVFLPYFSLYSILSFQQWTSCMGIHLSYNPIDSCHFEIHQWHYKDWSESDL